MILGSFYWCYVFSQVIGGLLTQYFGTKVVFGYSQFITAICSLLIPQAAVNHFIFVIILRSIQGIASVSCALKSTPFESESTELALNNRSANFVPGFNMASDVRFGRQMDTVQRTESIHVLVSRLDTTNIRYYVS